MPWYLKRQPTAAQTAEHAVWKRNNRRAKLRALPTYIDDRMVWLYVWIDTRLGQVIAWCEDIEKRYKP